MSLKEMKRKAAALKKDMEMGLLDRAQKSEYYGLLTQIQEMEEDEATERVDRYIQKRKDKE
jgi:hypothetical protein